MIEFVRNVIKKKTNAEYREPLKKEQKFSNCEKEIRILLITDTHDHVAAHPNQLEDFLFDVQDIDAVLILGDISQRDFEIICNHEKLSGIPMYGVLGNHDYSSILDEYNVERLHCKKATIGGIVFAGMDGSIKYKDTDSPMYTDEESLRIADCIPDCDVFITHDRAKVRELKETESYAHGGMLGIGRYITNRKPAYHLHGHLHENMTEDIAGCTSLGFCRYAYLKFDKTGMEILKVFGPKFLQNI